MKKITAFLISTVLILSAPGLQSYAAAASIVGQSHAARHSGGMQGPMRGVKVVGRLPNFNSGLASVNLSAAFSWQPANIPSVKTQALSASAALLKPEAGAQAAAGLDVPAALAASQNPQGPMGLVRLLEEKESLAISADKAAAMSAGQAKTSAASVWDRIFGIAPAPVSSQDAAPAPSENRSQGRLLAGQSGRGAALRPGPPPATPASRPGPLRNKIISGALALGRMAAAGGAVFGLQAAAAILLPSIFGLVPLAAVWAVMSGALFFPLAVYGRYRLGSRDSPRLDAVKWVLDVSLGAFLGAAAIAAPGLALVLSFQQLALSSVPVFGFIAGRLLNPGGTLILDTIMLGVSFIALPGFVGVAAAGLIGIGPLLGMMTLPVMTTLAFFLGRIIYAAESGRPFAVPGSLQKIRFPIFPWVMLGVTFALASGFPAVFATQAFIAWQFLGEKTYGWSKHIPVWKNALNNLLNFNTLYLGLLAFTAATGFASPLTFAVLAFAPERAAKWTEALLRKLLPKGEPAPSTQVEPAGDPDAQPESPSRWPNFHYRLKVGLLIGVMASFGLAMGVLVFGLASLGKNLAVAGIFSGISFFFAADLIKRVMRTAPATEASDPEFFAIMKELRERINAKRAQEKKKPIPMPEMVNDPLQAPNAYATGRSPFHALVGVTKVIKEMTLDPEELRASLIRLLAASAPEGKSKSFKVFRKAIAGSLPGVAPTATPRQVIEAVKQAAAADLKRLGVRALRGVLAHEFSHVMDRHMLLNAAAATINTGVSFAAYGILWSLSQAKAAAKRLKDRLFPRLQSLSERKGIVPAAAGLVLNTLPALLRVFAALWGPVVLQVTQMAASRADEGMADEDGAKLSNEPEALALALGLLTSWRPKEPGVAVIEPERLPLVAANAGMYTVNPLEQMHRAEALPDLDSAMDWVVGKRDDFLFNLFITHPDTTMRIEKLYDMSVALDADSL